MLPTRLRFGDLASDYLPSSETGGHARFEASDTVDTDFIDAIVDRWRESSTAGMRSRAAASVAPPDPADQRLDLGSIEAFASAPAKPR